MDQPLVLGTIPCSTRGSTRKGGRNRTKKQSCQPLADRPAKQGGLSTMAARTVRQGTADCPHPCRGLSGLSRGPSVKANRTSRTDPRKTDRPRRPGGPFAWVPGRSLLMLGPSANRLQRKPKAKPDQNETKQEHEERSTNWLLADCPPAPRGPSAPHGQN
jgi:hypothetical protein